MKCRETFWGDDDDDDDDVLELQRFRWSVIRLIQSLSVRSVRYTTCPRGESLLQNEEETKREAETTHHFILCKNTLICFLNVLVILILITIMANVIKLIVPMSISVTELIKLKLHVMCLSTVDMLSCWLWEMRPYQSSKAMYQKSNTNWCVNTVRRFITFDRLQVFFQWVYKRSKLQ